MSESSDRSLTIEFRQRGERLEMRRTRTAGGTEELHMFGSLLAHRKGPPLHVHLEEEELVEVVSGAASVQVNGERRVLKAGEPVCFPKGIAHTWWNDGDEELVLRGVVRPAIDLDRYLQAVFEVLDSGRPNRPPIFYMAHVMYRHRRTQLTPIVPRVVQRVLLPVVVLVGTVLGKYRGTAWPGCPSRCKGAPATPEEV